ncbi:MULTISPECIES: hypothetical protein [Kamptonema]|uniref:hypothetical protein n=1 Tax=Kamptonema TaxID=1501433 RepID=UPI0001DAC6F8|nr:MULTISPECIES: hypothetical protein [Kamptonema]CBN56773.1 conserved hypothetical protein [Kamptonema sp. PCC 6506]
MTDKISAPNVYLYAFQLYHNSEGSNNPLWQKCDNILRKFTYKKLTHHLKSPKRSHDQCEDLLLKTPLEFTRSNPLIEGFAQPLQIQDSYALWLNIGCPEDGTADNLDVSFIKEINPENILLIDGDDNFLGQTLLLTGWLTENNLPDNIDYSLPFAELCCNHIDYFKPIANQCRNALLPGDSTPIFYRSGILFGSPIFEYGLISDIANIANYRHLLVWLLCDKQTDKDFNTCQQEIIDLLFYRNKIIKSFQDSRKIYHDLVKNYDEIEEDIKYLQQQLAKIRSSLTTADLETLKQQLKVLLGKALSYTSVLRKLEAFDNTIAINLNNYSDILQKICDTLKTDKEELSILNHFEIKTAPYMRSQIAGDLGYFKHGTDLIESAIASIRGIVEIEQAKSDRALQTRVTVIGVGLGVSGVAATAYPYLIKQDPPNPINFTLSIIISLCLGVIAAAIAFTAIQIWPHLCPKKPRN